VCHLWHLVPGREHAVCATPVAAAGPATSVFWSRYSREGLEGEAMTRPAAPGLPGPIACSSCGATPDRLTPLDGAAWVAGRPITIRARCPACGGEIAIAWCDRAALTSYPRLFVGPGGSVWDDEERDPRRAFGEDRRRPTGDSRRKRPL
jgi:hypothetical protein